MTIEQLRARLFEGLVIPAHPLALTRRRTFDELHQHGLTKYYLDAGVGGIAVGVHTTQFAIHDASVGLYEPVLSLAREAVVTFVAPASTPVVTIAGVIGNTEQACREATIARRLEYDAALLSLAALRGASDEELIAHCHRVAEILPLFGFYLQTAVGGRVLGYNFWRRFVEIENVVAIKISPFNRYQTLDVVRAVLDASREKEIALYTGNDDSIIVDLLTTFEIEGKRTSIVGGLLGQWAVWTKRAVEIFERVKRQRGSNTIDASLVTLNAQLTDANGALFDVANEFAGCIAGIQEVLLRCGLVDSTDTLDERDRLSPGQMQEIDRVWRSYPQLRDD